MKSGYFTIVGSKLLLIDAFIALPHRQRQLPSLYETLLFSYYAPYIFKTNNVTQLTQMHFGFTSMPLDKMLLDEHP